MPDTGFMSPDNIVAESGVFFNTEWITPSTGVIVFFSGASNFQTVDGFENDGTLPAGATVVGAEVQLLESYSSPDGQTFDIQLSIDGGSNFSSAITSGNLGTSSGGSGAGADHLIPTSGGATELWGLDWSSFSDLSQIQLKGLNATANVVSQHVQLKIYYELPAAEPTNPSLKIIGGEVNINQGGIVAINRDLTNETSNPSGIRLRLTIGHQGLGPDNPVGRVRYAVGLTNSTRYDSNYLARQEFNITTANVFTFVQMDMFIPGAVSNDGTIDCYWYAEAGDGDFASFAVAGFADEVEDSQPGVDNDAYPLKLIGGLQNGILTSDVAVEDVEWES